MDFGPSGRKFGGIFKSGFDDRKSLRFGFGLCAIEIVEGKRNFQEFLKKFMIGDRIIL